MARRGVIPTEDARRKMSEAKKGKPKSDAHKAAIAAALKGRKRRPGSRELEPRKDDDTP